MANIKELIEYSKANPTSDIATKTQKAIQAGLYDKEASSLGVDLTWAGRPKMEQTIDTSKAPLTDRVYGTLQKYAGKQKESLSRMKKGEQGFLETGLQELGQGIGSASEVGFETLRSVPGLGKLIDKSIGVVGQSIAENKGLLGEIANSEKVQNALKEYELLSPRQKSNIEALFEVGTSIIGGGSAKPVAKGTVGAIKEGISTAEAIAKDTARSVRLSNARKSAQEAMEASRRILGKQAKGKIKDISKGIKVLSRLDTTGVETYRDLKGVVERGIEKNLDDIDAIYESVPGKRVLADLNIEDTVKVGDRTTKVTTNHVQEALDHLEETYGKAGMKKEQARIQLLKEQTQIDGLTPREINEIAREYGKEVGSKAFNKKGDALTSVNARMFENTRKGVKETARGFLPDDASKALDIETSEMIRVKDLVNNMEEAVSALESKIEKRNIFEKMGRGLGIGVDMATGGALRAFVTKLMPSNIGLKTLNSLHLQEKLAKDLKKIRDATTKYSDEQLVDFIKSGGKEIPKKSFKK